MDFSKNMHKGFAANVHTADYNRRDSKVNFWTRLSAEIVIAAVKDWRQLVKQKAWRKKPQANCNFTELRRFFKSEWCAFLMQDFELVPERMLKILEQELADAIRKDEIETWH